MTSFTPRAAALLACSFIVVLVTASCGSGSDPDPTEGVASGSAAATPAAVAPSESLLPEGTYRTLELTREQLLAAAKKAGLTRPQAEQTLAFGGIKHTAAFAVNLEGGRFTQFQSADGGAEGIGSRGTYEVVDKDTVLAAEECCGETTFGYKLERDSIRISWVKADQYADRQKCQSDAECAMAFIIWESSPFSRA
jgi:hypothetical protein